jgi:uncharacterized membrane protein
MNSIFLIFPQIILILLGLLGFLLASHIHNKKVTKKRLICPRKSDCNSVINSDYSKIFGIPVEVLGMIYYAFTAIYYGVFGIYFINLMSYPHLLDLIGYTYIFVLCISLCATLFSLYLVFIQAFKIRQWCMWCIGSAIISILIFAISLNSFFV